MIVSRSVSVSPVWSVSVSISIPSIWISFGFWFSFGFTFLDNMDGSTTVGVVGVWFYNSMGNWGIVVSVRVAVSSIVVWVGVDNWFDFSSLSFYDWFFCFFFSSFYCWKNILVVWIPVSVSVWMVSCGTMGVVIPGICLGFGLSAGGSEKSENYELKFKVVKSVKCTC